MGRRGSSSTKRTSLGHLKWLSRSRHHAMSSSPVTDGAGRELHEGGDLLAHVGVGRADDGDVVDGGVHDEHVLDLARVDVHAAADDHVRGPVGEVEVAVVVDPADVAQPAPAPRVPHLARLLGVAVVLEGAVRLEPHLALLADGELLAVVADDVDRAGHRLADRAGVGEPVLGADVGRSRRPRCRCRTRGRSGRASRCTPASPRPGRARRRARPSAGSTGRSASAPPRAA